MQNKYLTASQKPSFQGMQQQPAFNQNAALQSHLTKYNTVLAAKTQAKKEVKLTKQEQAKNDLDLKKFSRNYYKGAAVAAVGTGLLLNSLII